MSTETITSMGVNITDDGWKLITYLQVSNLYPQNQKSEISFKTKSDMIDFLKLNIKEIGNNKTSSLRIKPGIQYIQDMINKLMELN
jgi:uncharacterized protein YpuA (DUF1002 family)